MCLGSSPLIDGSGVLLRNRARVSTFFPSRTSTEFSTDRSYKMPMNNVKGEAPLDQILDDVGATGQATP